MQFFTCRYGDNLQYFIQEDYKDMKTELMKIWEKDKSSDQILYLMRETYASRRMEMKGFIGRPMFKICSNFPMLKESKYVSKYFYTQFQWQINALRGPIYLKCNAIMRFFWKIIRIEKDLYVCCFNFFIYTIFDPHAGV